MMRPPQSIYRGIVKNSAAMAAIVIAMSIYKNGLIFWSSWERAYILPGLIFMLLASALIWMRWDWAPYEAARRKAERDARKTS